MTNVTWPLNQGGSIKVDTTSFDTLIWNIVFIYRSISGQGSENVLSSQVWHILVTIAFMYTGPLDIFFPSFFNCVQYIGEKCKIYELYFGEIWHFR